MFRTLALMLCVLFPLTACTTSPSTSESSPAQVEAVRPIVIPPAMSPGERLENSPRHHEWALVKAPTGRTIRTWIAYPETEFEVPVVLIIHENRGLNDWARSLADQLAEAGYLAVAPDMLSEMAPGGGGTSDFATTDDARNAIYQLDGDNLITELRAVYQYATTLDLADGRIAVAGFCWGGSQTFRFATDPDAPELAAAFVFYGGAPDTERFANAKTTIYGFYGGNDARITNAVPEIEKQFSQLPGAADRYQPVIYDDAGHAFMRSGESDDGSEANRLARQKAWVRWIRILRELPQ